MKRELEREEGVEKNEKELQVLWYREEEEGRREDGPSRQDRNHSEAYRISFCLLLSLRSCFHCSFPPPSIIPPMDFAGNVLLSLLAVNERD